MPLSSVLPAALLPGVLLLEPCLQRREILKHRLAGNLARTRKDFQRFRGNVEVVRHLQHRLPVHACDGRYGRGRRYRLAHDATGSVATLNLRGACGMSGLRLHCAAPGPRLSVNRCIAVFYRKTSPRKPCRGASWRRHGAGLPNAPVLDLRLDATRARVIAATQGRGA